MPVVQVASKSRAVMRLCRAHRFVLKPVLCQDLDPPPPPPPSEGFSRTRSNGGLIYQDTKVERYCTARIVRRHVNTEACATLICDHTTTVPVTARNRINHTVLQTNSLKAMSLNVVHTTRTSLCLIVSIFLFIVIVIFVAFANCVALAVFMPPSSLVHSLP